MINLKNSGISKLGFEPLSPECNAEYLKKRFGKRKKAIKGCLLDQSVIAGIGNIYSDEILFRAKIYPSTPAKAIDDKMLNTLLTAGLQAPSAKNKRPCHIVVVKDKTMLAALASYNPNARMLADAACAMIVCGDRNAEGMKEFLYADCAAVSQNILLCAHGLGLGAVWCGVVMNSDWKKRIAKELKFPVKVEPISVIALGYPNESKEEEDRWDAGKIHFDRW